MELHLFTTILSSIDFLIYYLKIFISSFDLLCINFESANCVIFNPLNVMIIISDDIVVISIIN